MRRGVRLGWTDLVRFPPRRRKTAAGDPFTPSTAKTSVNVSLERALPASGRFHTLHAMKPLFASLLLALAFPALGTTSAVRAADILLPNGDRIAGASILSNGDFSEDMGDWDIQGFVGGRPDGSGRWNNDFTIKREPNGKTYGRLSCLDTDGANLSLQPKSEIPLVFENGYDTLVLSYRIRIAQLTLGERNYNTLRFSLTWFDPDDKKLGEDVVEFRKDIPAWRDEEKRIKIPAGATYVRFSLVFLGCTGIADVTEIKLTPLASAASRK